MEILIATITLGVVASLAFYNYQNVMEQNYCRNAQTNLLAIQSAAVIYGAKINMTADITSGNITQINNTLRLNISDPQFNYTLGGSPKNFVAEATRSNSAYSCEIKAPASGVTCSNQDYCPDVPRTST